MTKSICVGSEGKLGERSILQLCTVIQNRNSSCRSSHWESLLKSPFWLGREVLKLWWGGNLPARQFQLLWAEHLTMRCCSWHCLTSLELLWELQQSRSLCGRELKEQREWERGPEFFVQGSENIWWKLKNYSRYFHDLSNPSIWIYQLVPGFS